MIENNSCMMMRLPAVIVVDSPLNKENIPPAGDSLNVDMNVPLEEEQQQSNVAGGVKVTGFNNKMIEFPKFTSVKAQFNPLSLSTDCILGRREDSWHCSTPSRFVNDKTRLQVEAENIRKITRLSPAKSKLEVITKTSQPELNCLCTETVAKLVTGQYNHLYDRIIVVDCRFEYEYRGGHIKGALNFSKEDDVDKYFIKDNTHHLAGDKLCIVFHCEFSSHRGPKSYKRVRANDRKLNEPSYPDLFYPEMYLLEGGYKQFFKDFPELCEPQGYVEMKDPSYIPQMKLGMQGRGRSKSQRRFWSQSCNNISLELENNPDNDSDEESKFMRAQTSRLAIKTIKERH
jgi:rhodanese-related sulfurtransferase